MIAKTFKIISNEKCVFSIEYTNWKGGGRENRINEFEIHFHEYYNDSNLIDRLMEIGFIITDCDYSYRDYMRLYNDNYDIEIVLYST